MKPTFRELLGLSGELPGRGCLIIGEVAQAHDGSLGTAHAFIDAIADAGADAVKFQTHIAAAESTKDEPWRVKFSQQDETRYDYWKRMEFTEPQWRGLRAHALERGLLFLSSPFSPQAVHLLRDVGVSAWKVASGEIMNAAMFEAMAATELPFIVSSGISPMAELDQVVERITARGLELAMLQCTTAYPCPAEKVGLNVIEDFQNRYNCYIGLSDHSGTPFPGIAAATLGIDVLEVHVTLNRRMFGPDVPASVTVEELMQLTQGVRFVEKMVAHPVDKDATAAELRSLRTVFTKSLVAARDLHKGSVLREGDLVSKKPGTGIPDTKLGELLNKTLLRDLRADEQIRADDVS